MHKCGEQRKYRVLCSIALYLISLRQGLSLSLEVDEQPAPVSNPHSAEVTGTCVAMPSALSNKQFDPLSRFFSPNLHLSYLKMFYFSFAVVVVIFFSSILKLQRW